MEHSSKTSLACVTRRCHCNCCNCYCFFRPLVIPPSYYYIIPAALGSQLDGQVCLCLSACLSPSWPPSKQHARTHPGTGAHQPHVHASSATQARAAIQARPECGALYRRSRWAQRITARKCRLHPVCTPVTVLCSRPTQCCAAEPQPQTA